LAREEPRSAHGMGFLKPNGARPDVSKTWWRTHSGSNQSPTPKFPANREINREFCGFWRLAADFDTQSARRFNGLQPDSLRDGTGNFQTGIREIFSGNREFSREMFRC
jgi:hypothetical protein